MNGQTQLIVLFSTQLNKPSTPILYTLTYKISIEAFPILKIDDKSNLIKKYLNLGMPYPVSQVRRPTGPTFHKFDQIHKYKVGILLYYVI